MNQPALKSTITHQVRKFISDQGVVLHPWSGLDETYGRLYELMSRHKNDPTFWEPLKSLLETVVDNSFSKHNKSQLPAPSAELLAMKDIETLVRDLRQAIPGGVFGVDRASVSRFGASLPAPVLCGFLLLGIAAASGCDNTEATDTSTDSNIQTVDSETDTVQWDNECGLEQDSVFWTTINNSVLSDSQKTHMCDCLADLNTDWNTGLSDLFTNGTPDQIANALEDMLACCQGGDKLNQPFSESKDLLIESLLCEPVALYKGVPFPSK